MKVNSKVFKRIFFVFLGFVLLSTVHADESYLPDESITEKIKKTKKDDQKSNNWELKGTLSSNSSFTNNKNYVGQTDGSIYQFNIITEEEVNFRKGQHELLNNLKIKYGLSKTPQLEEIFKSQDQFKYLGTYLYRLKKIPWLGPFGRLSFSTSLFSGYYVSPNNEDLLFNYRDGSTDTRSLEANKRYKIVDPFEPMTIRGNYGFFANPYDNKKLKLNLKLGVGFQKIITCNGFVLADDSSTSIIEFKQLEDSDESGLEFETDVAGMINDNIQWSLVANLFLPLKDSESDDDIEGIDKMSTDIEGKISSKITKNISLDYFLILKRLPMIVDEWQIQNGVVVSISYDLF